MKYRADVDGLRAVAVLPVLLFHSGVSLFSGGYVGVDIFFVISGFVITSKLTEDIGLGRFSVADFYVRRIRRIMPALIATIVASYIAALVLFLPNAMADFSRSVVSTALFISNMYFWKNSGYFETQALDRPLLHTWSLSVEEQFYIVIPIAMFLAVKFLKRHAWILFALAAAVSLALSIFITDKAPTANFFILPTRAWELLLGSLLVLMPLKSLENKILREGLALLAIGMIAVSIVLYTDATPFPGLTALVPTLGAALLIYLGRDHTSLVSRALAWKPMIWVGLISYSLYLVHWPIIVFARYALLRDLEGWEIAAAVVSSLLLAWFSYRFIETPFRRPAKPLSRWPLFGVTAVLLVAMAGAGYAGMKTGGFHDRYPDFRPPQAAKVSSDIWLGNKCFLQDQDASAWAGDLCVRTTGAPKNALLWGDSFAAHYMPGLLANSGSLSHNVVQYTFAGCPPILSYESFARPGCHGFNAKVFDVIDRYKIDTVVISARWDQLRQRGLGGLDETVEKLKARGITVYVLGQSPMFAFDADVLDYRKAGRVSPNEASWYLSFPREDNARLKAAAGPAIFIDPLDSFCRGDQCRYRMDGKLQFNDYGHFSEIGSSRAVQAYFPLYVKPAASPTPAP